MAETTSNTEDREIKQYKGKMFGKRTLSKDALETISQLEEQQAEAAEKGKRRGMFGNVGAAVGSLVVGFATGGASLLAQSAAVGAAAYGGSRAGRGIADATQEGGRLGKMKRLSGSLMSKSKDSQAGSFRSMLEAQEKGAQKGAMLSAGGAFILGGGGQYIGKGVEKGAAKIFGEGSKVSDFVNTRLSNSKTFNPSQTPVSEMRPLYGNTKMGFEQASKVTVNPVSPQSTYTGPVSNVNYGGAADIKQAGLPIAEARPSTAYTGSASQNRFVLEASGIGNQKSIVDSVKAGMIEGATDSTMAGRGSIFDRLGGQTAYEKWLNS